MSARDLGPLKSAQRGAWAAGDYSAVAVSSVIVSELLCESAGVLPGHAVLDVACGSGNTTIAAARRFADVVGLDYVRGLLLHARRRAEVEGVRCVLVEADAERLPFADATFDVVLSTFGVMFAPDQERCACELVRVTRPGGRIAMASWSPHGALGELFDLVSRYVPPTPGSRLPVEWGDERRLRELFDGCDFQVTSREFVFRYRSPEHWLEHFVRFFGPTRLLLSALPRSTRLRLEGELLDLWRRRNVDSAGRLVAPAAYTEAIVTRT